MEGYRPETYGDGFADVYDEWYAEVSPPAATADFVRARVRGLVVEFGSGTGRLAGPLRDRGVDVVGIDASLPMLDRSRKRWSDVPVVAGDMAEPPLREGCAGAVLVAFNTLFNLPSSALQRQCLRRAADLIGTAGVVIVEAFVPSSDPPNRADHVELGRMAADHVVLRVSRTDHDARTVSGQHIELRDGEPVRLRPWHLHYTDPDGLERLAASAGLALAERFADWSMHPFDDAAHTHVSVFGPAKAHR